VQAFRIPWLPEFLMRRQNFEALVQALCETRRADANSQADVAVYRAAWSRPGALTAMVNWYRALMRKELLTGPLAQITPRTLIIWGTQEKFAIQGLAEKSRALCVQGSVSYLDATHWVQHDEPDHVNALLTEFLR
jgi:pimeloyl-ACP methyl ester carboxylesterase